MKTYSNHLEYQRLISAYEKAIDLFKAAKATKEEVENLFKATKKEENLTKTAVHIAHFQFKLAKLKQRTEKLSACIAHLNLKEWIHNFKKAEKKSEKANAKIDGIETAMLKNGVGNHTDVLEKPSSKAKSKSEKSQKIAKLAEKSTKVETEKLGKVKMAKKEAKKLVFDAKEVAKAAKKTAEKSVVEAKGAKKTSGKIAVVETKAAVKITQKTREKPAVKEAVRPVEIAQPAVKKEVVILKRTTINDLTTIEGIGPKIAQILYGHDVKNFKALNATPLENLKTWLKENKMPFVDPRSWAEQAQLADAGKTAEFEALKKELKGGKRVQQ